MKNLLVLLLLFSPMSLMAGDKLDLRIKDVGYRWVQDLESGENMSAMRVFTTFGITKSDSLRVGWNRRNINNPFENGVDTVMFQYQHNFK